MMRSQARARMRTAWGWSWSAGAGLLVEVGGPGVGLPGVAGEVDDGVAELFVDGPPERDDFDLAGRWVEGAAPARQPSDSGGEPAAGVADLGEQPGGADGAGAGQRGEDRGVGVGGELVGDLVSRASIWARSALSAATRARVIWARAAASAPVVPAGASCRWAQSR